MKKSKGQKRWNRQSGRLAKSNCEGASGQRQRRMPTDHHRIWQWKHHRKTEEFEETLESILEQGPPEEAQRHLLFWLRGIVPASLTSPPPPQDDPPPRNQEAHATIRCGLLEMRQEELTRQAKGT